MKRLMISGLAAVALLAAATTMLRSHSSSTDRPVGAADTASLQQSRIATGSNKLPTENFEDMSLVFSTVAKR
jgi:hypothetical protein